MPRIEIALSKIRDNTRILTDLYGQKGISIMGVSKAVLGEPAVVKAMIQGGVKFIADSRIENIQKMKKAGITTRFVLLRTPISRSDSIVKYADVSLNTEIETIKKLSFSAKAQKKIHQIIIMVEMGDLREGLLPCDLSSFIKETLTLTNIKIIGIGCNLACYAGIKPDDIKMNELSKLVGLIEKEFDIDLEIISGGNSANYDWFKSTKNIGKINNFRIGESILLGLETIGRQAIPGLHTDIFQLVAEVIEFKNKPSLPFGSIGQDAFGNIPSFQNRGMRQRVIIALGRQDLLMSSMKVENGLEFLGSSSDHMILESNNKEFNVGDEVKFSLDYSGVLAAMTSPFIKKEYIKSRAYAAA